jgi:hypothetical protein
VDDTDRLRYVDRVTRRDYNWTLPLAQLLDRDSPASAYGARYAPSVELGWSRQLWTCRSCGSGTPPVTDRYQHELDAHRGPYFAELAALESTVVALFGPGPTVPPRRDGDDRP